MEFQGDRPKRLDWGKISPSEEETLFLQGKTSKFYEFKRAFRILMEFVQGFRFLHPTGPCVTVFGSARFSSDHPYYQLAQEVGNAIGKEGFALMTGGGPGIMEAANRGAKEAGALSLGCNIELPQEQKPNPYLDRWMEFRYFFVRKVMLVKYSSAFVVLPGGFGTMDELFEIATLIQTGKIKNFPVILMGIQYWTPLLRFMEETLIKSETIDDTDKGLITLTDDPLEAARIVCRLCRSK